MSHKFLCELERNAKQSAAKWKEYTDVNFGDNFSRFLSALEIDKLCEDAKPISTKGGYVWSNSISEGRLYLYTSSHPLLGPVKHLKVGGSAYNIQVFESILKRYAGLGEEVKPEEVKADFPYHEKLNPGIWNDLDGEYQLKSTVQEKLLDTAETFLRTLKATGIPLNNIVITGSNANYNWTEHSDVDLHIIVDIAAGAKKYGSILREYLSAKTRLWNLQHDVKIHGYNVEIYVQDAHEPHTASGMYSLKDDQWLVEPEHKKPDYDDLAVRTKVAEYMNMIDDLTSEDEKGCNTKAAEEIMEKLKVFRQAGLTKGGEFSVENLVFKALRNNQYIAKLAECRTKGLDTRLSSEEEEWWRE